MKETNHYSWYLDVPFDVTRHSLYNAGELYKGYEPAADDEADKQAFANCYDSRVYRHYMAMGKNPQNVDESLARTLHDHGIHMALDTSGHAPWETLARFLPAVDLFLYDFKAADPARHKTLTGVDNALILANLEKLAAARARIFLRCPLVPGVNDDAHHLEAIAALTGRLPSIEEVTLEPYHPLGLEKCRKFGKTPLLAQADFPSKATCDAWLSAVRARTSTRVVLA